MGRPVPPGGAGHPVAARPAHLDPRHAGIKANFDVIERWHQKQAELLQIEGRVGMLPNNESALFGEGNSPVGGHRYKRTLLFSLRTPIIFSLVWGAFGLLCTALSFMD